MDKLKEQILPIIVLFGSIFTFFACLGVLRFKDIFIRLHAGSKAIAFGIGFIMIAVGINFNSAEIWIKVLLVLFFLLLTSPLIAHLISKVANLKETKFD